MIAALAVIVPALMVAVGTGLAMVGALAWINLLDRRTAARRSSPTPYTTATPTTWER